MNQVVLISDNTFFGPTGVSRYLGPYALANGLENHGIKTSIIDYSSWNQNFLSVLETQLSAETLIVGISSTFLSEPLSQVTFRSPLFSWKTASNYLTTPPLSDDPAVFDQWLTQIRQLMSRICPKAKIVVGGAKVQSLFNYRLPLFKEIDYLVWGGVDGVFHEIYRDIQTSGDAKHFVFEGRKIIDTVSSYLQIKGCPPMRWRTHWNIQPGEALPIEISRGCRFNCKFCHYDKREAFRKDLETLRAEFIKNYEDYGTQFYHFCDDCFNDHPQKVNEVCRLIMDLPFKIEWVSYARVDVAVKYPETAEFMVRSGARGLFWGLESFNAEAARKAGKGTPPDEVKKFLKNFYQKYKDECTSQGSFIVGLPGETIDSQRETIKWVCQEEALHFVNVGPLRVSPYKEIFDKKVLDYAEYSRNPEKYGFEYIQFFENKAESLSENWKHSTMDFSQAIDLTVEFSDEWKNSSSRHRGLIPSIWSYPHLRSLGYSQEQVFEMHFNEDKKNFYLQDAAQRFHKRTQVYFQSFAGKGPL